MKHTIKLAIALDGGLPTEFRLFVKGWNDSEKGKFLFDAAAAKAVMAAYQAWGIDVPIDLEHQMMAEASADPTARDARGWCKLVMKPDGSLWAVDVKWTPDGAQRLSEKRQRYISPCFETFPNSRRVSKVLNVAITALPATHHTPALLAASAKGTSSMNPDLIKKALEALQNGDDAAATEILKGMIVSAASGDPEAAGDKDGGEDDGASGGTSSDPPVTESEPPQAGADDADEAAEADPSKKGERKAMRAMLRAITGAKTFAEALLTAETWKASHISLEREREALAAQRATLESAERRKLVGDLVRLGAEFPSTVFADDKGATLKSRWVKMPIEELRAHVDEQKQARNDKAPGAPKIPAGSPAGGSVGGELTPQELAICKDMNCDPKEFLRLKIQRDGK